MAEQKEYAYGWMEQTFLEDTFRVIIVAFLENATIGYSLESVCVFLCLCVCFCTITQKEIHLGT